MSEETAVDLTGIDAAFHEVVTEFGREMFVLVYNAGMAGEAAKHLLELAQKHRSVGGVKGVEVLTSCFNTLSNDYVGKMGWTGEQLAACDQAIKLAFHGKLVVPPEGSRIMLQ